LKPPPISPGDLRIDQRVIMSCNAYPLAIFSHARTPAIIACASMALVAAAVFIPTYEILGGQMFPGDEAATALYCWHPTHVRLSPIGIDLTRMRMQALREMGLNGYVSRREIALLRP
jgi:hypothetical protein